MKKINIISIAILIILVVLSVINYQNNKKLYQKINAIADMVGVSSKENNASSRLADIQTSIDHIISTTETTNSDVADIYSKVGVIKGSVDDLYSNLPFILGRADLNCRCNNISY